MFRHAYFTGGDQPYEKLQRALRAEVDEAAWAELYSTRSRPFDRPETGKIAVKVINHYGDEVLKVFGVGEAIGCLRWSTVSSTLPVTGVPVIQEIAGD